MGKRERRRRREATALVATLTESPLPAPRDAPTLDGLHALVQRREQLERAIEWDVDRLAGVGIGWPPIAAVLGVSRQAVRQASLRRRERLRQPKLSCLDGETSV